MKHKCDGRKKEHKCIECAHCDVNDMKCHPDSKDCEEEYDLLFEDLIKEDVCDFFVKGVPFIEIPSCSFEHVSGMLGFLVKCPHCGYSQDLCGIKSVYETDSKLFYRCNTCKKLYAL